MSNIIAGLNRNAVLCCLASAILFCTVPCAGAQAAAYEVGATGKDAAAAEGEAIFRTILSARPDMNRVDKYGYTLLHDWLDPLNHNQPISLNTCWPTAPTPMPSGSTTPPAAGSLSFLTPSGAAQAVRCPPAISRSCSKPGPIRTSATEKATATGGSHGKKITG